MFRPADITLYVPAFRAEATLPACLEAVRAQTLAPARILVVDDGSPEPVRTDVAEVLRHGANRGLAASRNTALAACRTPLLAALDADVVPEPDWLEHLLEALHSGPFAGVGGRLDEHFQDATADQWRSVHMAQHWGDEPVRHPRFLFGANTLFRTDALRDAGGYDPALRTNNEDRTLCDALYAAGHDLLYTPRARARHLRRDTGFSILRGYWKWHHAKGLLRGDFDSPAGLLARIPEVNFGIFRYRFNLDRQAGRLRFLPLDAAIPWVFSTLDLELFTRRTAQPVPAFPNPGLLAGLPNDTAAVLATLAPAPPPNAAPAPAADKILADYPAAFAAGLAAADWFRQTLEPLVPWTDFNRELIHERGAA
jgi:GT2 family glycosyltransferase